MRRRHAFCRQCVATTTTANVLFVPTATLPSPPLCHHRHHAAAAVAELPLPPPLCCHLCHTSAAVALPPPPPPRSLSFQLPRFRCRRAAIIAATPQPRSPGCRHHRRFAAISAALPLPPRCHHHHCHRRRLRFCRCRCFRPLRRQATLCSLFFVDCCLSICNCCCFHHTRPHSPILSGWLCRRLLPRRCLLTTGAPPPLSRRRLSSCSSRASCPAGCHVASRLLSNQRPPTGASAFCHAKANCCLWT